MNKRITFRIDEETEEQFNKLNGSNIINLSALTREALKFYFNNHIDNREEHNLLEKGKEK